MNSPAPRANTSKETCISNYKNDYMQWDRLSKLGVIIQYWKKTPACMIVLLWSIMKDFGNQRGRFHSRIYHCYQSIYEIVFMNTNMIYDIWNQFQSVGLFLPIALFLATRDGQSIAKHNETIYYFSTHSLSTTGCIHSASCVWTSFFL